MIVYVAFQDVPYDGSEFIGVYSNIDLAKSACHGHLCNYYPEKSREWWSWVPNSDGTWIGSLKTGFYYTWRVEPTEVDWFNG